MKLNLLLAGLVLMAMSTGANAHDPRAHAKKPVAAEVSDAAKPAVAVVDQFSTALKDADFQRVKDLLADDVLILESGGAERSPTSTWAITRSRTRCRTARLEGSFAWVGTESELHTTKDGQPLTLLSTETMVLKKSAAGWQIVHVHWSSRPKKAS